MLGAIIAGLSAAAPLIKKGIGLITKVAKPAASIAATAGGYVAAERAIDYVSGSPAMPTQALPALPPLPAPSSGLPTLAPQAGASMTPVASPYGAVYAPPRTWGRQQKIDYLSQFAIDESLVTVRRRPPPGFVSYKRSDGRVFSVDKQAAIRAGLYKRRPKPLLTAGEGKLLKEADKITKKVRKVAASALSTRGLKITSKYAKPKKGGRK